MVVGRHQAADKVPVLGECRHPLVGKARGVADVPAHTAEVYLPGPSCLFFFVCVVVAAVMVSLSPHVSV